MVFFGPQLVEKLFLAECSNASCRCYVSTELRERDSQRKKFAMAYPIEYSVMQATSISKEKEKSCALRPQGLTWRGHAYSNTINDIMAQLLTGLGNKNIHCK